MLTIQCLCLDGPWTGHLVWLRDRTVTHFVASVTAGLVVRQYEYRVELILNSNPKREGFVAWWESAPKWDAVDLRQVVWYPR